jgi:hypothetical protein
VVERPLLPDVFRLQLNNHAIFRNFESAFVRYKKIKDLLHTTLLIKTCKKQEFVNFLTAKGQARAMNGPCSAYILVVLVSLPIRDSGRRILPEAIKSQQLFSIAQRSSRKQLTFASV